jgi:hypothetical protein
MYRAVVSNSVGGVADVQRRLPATNLEERDVWRTGWRAWCIVHCSIDTAIAWRETEQYRRWLQCDSIPLTMPHLHILLADTVPADECLFTYSSTAYSLHQEASQPAVPS